MKTNSDKPKLSSKEYQDFLEFVRNQPVSNETVAYEFILKRSKEAFSAHDPQLLPTRKDISKALGMPKSSVSDKTRELIAKGHIIAVGKIPHVRLAATNIKDKT